MKLKELKQKLNEFPPECDDFDVVFGESAWGEADRKIQKLGKKIFLSFF